MKTLLSLALICLLASCASKPKTHTLVVIDKCPGALVDTMIVFDLSTQDTCRFAIPRETYDAIKKNDSIDYEVRHR